jgi:hypothetical protein
MNPRNAFLFVGSPKGLKSTSQVLGDALVSRLEAGGMTVNKMIVGSALHSAQGASKMHEAVEAADLIIFSFPLYVDQLPAPMIRAAELIAEHRRIHPPARPQKIMAIVQCGFPEARQNQTARDIMREFAREAGFGWAGGLLMGMGGAVDGRSLEKAGGMVRNVVRALDLTAAALLRGEDVPVEAATLTGKPFIPGWIYRRIGDWSFRRLAKRHGVRGKLYDRPYECGWACPPADDRENSE